LFVVDENAAKRMEAASLHGRMHGLARGILPCVQNFYGVVVLLRHGCRAFATHTVM